MDVILAPGFPTGEGASRLPWNDDLRTFVDGRYPLWLIRQHAKIIEVCPTAPAFFGVGRADELIGRSVLDFVHPDDRQYVSERIATAFDSGRPVPPALIRMLHAHDIWRVLEVTGNPVEYRGAPAVLVVARDVTLSSRDGW